MLPYLLNYYQREILQVETLSTVQCSDYKKDWTGPVATAGLHGGRVGPALGAAAGPASDQPGPAAGDGGENTRPGPELGLGGGETAPPHCQPVRPGGPHAGIRICSKYF